MKLPRRRLLYLTVGAVALPAVARADTYPSRPMRVVVGFPAGLAPDVVARLVAKPLSERLGQPVVIENRPGAGGNIGTEIVVTAQPDGYTLLLVISGNAINATLYPNLTFNFIRDIAPIAFIGVTPLVMVLNPSVPAKTVPEFIAYAKANPGKLNMASPGNGTAMHLAGELFKMMTGVDLVHVPYRGNYMPDLLGGQVQVYFSPISSAIGYVQAGKLRALGVTSATRLGVMPDVPAVGEYVPGYEASGWLGIGSPKSTPAAIIDRLNQEINTVIADPDTRAALVGLGVEPMSTTPDQFAKLIADATEKWARVIKFANIKAD